MSNGKIRFTRYLIAEQMGGAPTGALPGATSANILGSAQMGQNKKMNNKNSSFKRHDCKYCMDAGCPHCSDSEITAKLDNIDSDDDSQGNADQLFQTLKSLITADPAQDVKNDEWGPINPDGIPNEYQPAEQNIPPAKIQYSSDHPQGDTQSDKFDRLLGAIEELRKEIAGNQRRSPNDISDDGVQEENEEESTSFATARQLFQSLVGQKLSRRKIIDAFQKRIGVTNSTAVSYYQRLAKDAGLTTSGERTLNSKPGMPQGMGAQTNPLAGAAPNQGGVNPQTSDDLLKQKLDSESDNQPQGKEVPNDPDRQGLIRFVKGAHLVYKRQNNEGTYDELWQIKISGDLDDALEVRRAILAGTDIPPRATKSQDGSQSYTLTTLGNAQILAIKNLPQ